MSNFQRVLYALALAGAMLLAACGGSAGDAPRKNQQSSDIAVGAPNGGGPGLSAFADQARKATCAELNNRLYLIDQNYVFWTRVGNCPDNGYSHVLYGATPEALLCSQGDTIAGPRTSCTDPALRPRRFLS